MGGASTRFGSPKALVRLDGATLAERAWHVLGEGCDERIAVGKGNEALPFPVLADGVEERAAIHGLVAGLRAAQHEIAFVLPVDCPCVTSDVIRELAAACRDAAVAQTGPLPGAYAKSALRVLEQHVSRGQYSLRGALAELEVARVDVDDALLVNVNTPHDLPRARFARGRAV